MPGPNADRMTRKYLARTQAAGGDYVEGMQDPRRDPKAAARAANGKWKNRVTEAVNEDRWVKGIEAYDYAEAVRIATEDGGAAYTAGIQKRANKIAQVHQRLAPQLARVSQTIQSMPQNTPADREQRMLANLREMRKLKGAGSR